MKEQPLNSVLSGALVVITTLVGTLIVSSVVSYEYINPKLFAFSIGTALISCACLANTFTWWKKTLRQPMVWGIGIYSLVLVISSYISIDPVISWFGAIDRGSGVFFFLLCVIMSLSIGATFSKEEAKKYILVPIVISGVLLVGSVWLERAGWNFLKTAGGGGLLGNTSMTGTFLLFSLFIAAYLFFSASNRTPKIIAAIAFFVMLINPIFISFARAQIAFDYIGAARGALGSLIFGAIVACGIWLSSSFKKTTKAIGMAIIAASIVFAAIALVLLAQPNSGVHRWFVAQETDTRFMYWNAALKGFSDKPLLGTGPETFPYTYQKYFDPRVMLKNNTDEIWSNKPHNSFLQVLTETGIIGSIAYLCFMTGIVIAIRRLGTKGADIIGMSVFGGFFAAYLLNNVLFFDTITSLYLFFLALAFLLSSVPKANNDIEIGAYKTYRYGFAGILVLLVCCIAIPQLRKAHRAYLEFTLPLQSRTSWYKKVEDTSSYGSGLFLGERADFTYQSVYLPSVNDILKQSEANKKIALDAIGALMNQIQTDAKRYPPNEQGELALGRLASLEIVILNKTDAQLLQTMQGAAKEAIALAPTNPQGYLLLGQEYVYEQTYDEAFAVFDQARSLEPALPFAHQALINLATVIRDEQKVAFYTQQAIQESPEFAQSLGIRR